MTAPASPPAGRGPAAADVVNDDDPFDADGFDAAAWVNARFPDESSLAGLDEAAAALRAKIAQVDAEILEAVRGQDAPAAKARQDLAAAKAAVADLAARVASVQAKAASAAALVDETCRDVRALDAARRNLGAGITALRRLGLLATATDQLGAAAERGDLGAASPLVDAVTELGAHFQAAAGAVPAVRALAERGERLRAGLAAAATRVFELLPSAGDGSGGSSNDALPPELLARLGEAARVLRAVGGRAPDAAVGVVCARELGAYQQIFWTGAVGGGGSWAGAADDGPPAAEAAPPSGSLPTTGPAAVLARTERRFAWLRARTRARASLWAALPPEWRAEEALCLAFARVTRGQLAEVLDAAAAGGSASSPAHVEALLLAVKAANDWEAEMEGRFGGGGASSSSSSNLTALDESWGPEDEAPASRVRARAEAAARARAAAAAGAGSAAAGGAVAAAEAAGGGGSAASAAGPPSPFRGAISSVFEPHLAAYVAAEEASLSATLASLLAEPGAWGDGGSGGGQADGGGVLPAAPALFAAVKRALTRCARHVSRGAALLSLAAAFQRVLGGYAGAMRRRVPGPAGGGGGGSGAPPPPSASSTEWWVRVPADADLARLGALVSTAEYCARVCAELAGAVRRTVDERALAASRAAVGAGRVHGGGGGGGGGGGPPSPPPPLPPPASGPPPLVLDLASLDEDGGGAAFEGVAAAGAAAGAAALLTRLADPWAASVARTPWAAVESVGDASPSASASARSLTSGAAALAPALPPLHWRFVSDRVLAGAGPLLLGAVRGARAVSEPGAQQLLLEVGVLKDALAGLGAAAGGREAPHSTAAAAARAAAPAEALLKVVGARPSAIPATFAAVMPGGSRSDLAGALDLKAGLGRAEAGAILAAVFGGASGGGGSPRPPGSPPPPPPPPLPPAAGAAPPGASPGLPAAAAAARRFAHAAVPGPRAAAAVERAREAMRGLSFGKKGGGEGGGGG